MSRSFLLVVLGVGLALGTVHADLKSFKEQVEQAEAQPQDEPQKAEPAAAKDEPKNVIVDGEPMTFGDAVARAVFGLFQILWVADNASTTYGGQPYDEGGFVRLPDETRRPAPGRDFWFAAETQAFALDGLGGGAWAAIQGHAWRFVGPYAEAWALTDGGAALYGLRLGAEFSVVQADPFNLSLYGQYQLWAGALGRQGGTGGMVFRSYPARPLTLQARFGFQAFPAFQLGEVETQAGWMVGSVEYYAGWRWWNLVQRGPDLDRSYHGPYLGLRNWF